MGQLSTRLFYRYNEPAGHSKFETVVISHQARAKKSITTDMHWYCPGWHVGRVLDILPKITVKEGVCPPPEEDFKPFDDSTRA